MLAKSRSLITSPRARIFRLFTQTRYQGPNWLGLHACVTGVHCTVRRLKTQHPHAPSRALGAPSSAAGRRACGRPRRGAVAAVLPHWDDDDDRLPGGRLTRALPPRANGHDRGAWCERRNRAASARWAPRLPGQPASRLHWHALRRVAFDNFGSDRRGLRARHADTHAQSNTCGARGLKVRRSPSIAARRPPPRAKSWGDDFARCASYGFLPCPKLDSRLTLAAAPRPPGRLLAASEPPPLDCGSRLGACWPGWPLEAWRRSKT